MQLAKYRVRFRWTPPGSRFAVHEASDVIAVDSEGAGRLVLGSLSAQTDAKITHICRVRARPAKGPQARDGAGQA